MNWIPIEQELPEMYQMLWLYDANKGTVWIGGRAEADDDEWLWGNSYGSIWHNGEYWSGDMEIDHDYQPTHWLPLPELPAKEEA